MARTITVQILKFEELSDAAKKVARNWWRGGETRDSYDWEQEAYQAIRQFCEVFGIDYESSSFYNGDFNVRFGAIGDEIRHEMTGRRLIAYITNKFDDYLWERKGYGKYRKMSSGKWDYPRRSRCQLVENSCPFTGTGIDESLMQPIRDYLKKPDMTWDYEDLMREALESWGKDCRSDVEYQDSDEYADDAIIANEYEFNEDGTKY